MHGDDLPPLFRATERATQGVTKAGAKSIWQLFGAGAIGGQAIVGIPAVKRLKDELGDKALVWPLETGWRALTPDDLAAREVVLAEVYPAMVTPKPEPGEAFDRAQVRALAEHFAKLDEAGKLAADLRRAQGHGRGHRRPGRKGRGLDPRAQLARPDLVLAAVQQVRERLALGGEGQGGGVDAVAQPRGRRAVGEDVALVAAAARADRLGAHHAVAGVADQLQVRQVVGLGEARPAGAALELRPSARNSGRPQRPQQNTPLRFSPSSTPQKGASVPCARSTRWASGSSRASRSASWAEVGGVRSKPDGDWFMRRKMAPVRPVSKPRVT